MNEKTLILEYDDFHWKYPENCLETIKKFVQKFPNIKISLFTTVKHSGHKISINQAWCSEVRKLISSGNIALAVHGLYHTSEEFKFLSKSESLARLLDAENEFNQSNLPFVKVFRGPHWGINQNAYDALIELGYTHIYTHEDYKNLAQSNTNIKNVIYNWNLKDESTNDNLLVAHGHTHDVCGNGIDQTLERVSKFIESNNVKFKFVNEYE